MIEHENVKINLNNHISKQIWNTSLCGTTSFDQLY